MNAIFTAVCVLSAILICLSDPSQFLPTLLNGTKSAAECALVLFCIYTAWMGLSAVAEESRLTNSLSRLLAPACRKIFKTDDEEAVKNLAMNVSCNMLGIGGAATPYGVKAIERMEQIGHEFGQNLLFIINSTSIQLIPTTAITLRAANGSASAYDIVLPSLIATLSGTLLAAAVYTFLYVFKLKRRKKCSI